MCALIFVSPNYGEGVYQMLGFSMGSVEYVKYKIMPSTNRPNWTSSFPIFIL